MFLLDARWAAIFGKKKLSLGDFARNTVPLPGFVVPRALCLRAKNTHPVVVKREVGCEKPPPVRRARVRS